MSAPLSDAELLAMSGSPLCYDDRCWEHLPADEGLPMSGVTCVLRRGHTEPHQGLQLYMARRPVQWIESLRSAS